MKKLLILSLLIASPLLPAQQLWELLYQHPKTALITGAFAGATTAAWKAWNRSMQNNNEQEKKRSAAYPSKPDIAKSVIAFLRHNPANLSTPLITLILGYAENVAILDVQKDARAIVTNQCARQKTFWDTSFKHSGEDRLWSQCKDNFRFPISSLHFDGTFLNLRLFNMKPNNSGYYGGYGLCGMDSRCYMAYHVENTNNNLVFKQLARTPLGSTCDHAGKICELNLDKQNRKIKMPGDTSLELPLEAPQAHCCKNGISYSARVIDHDPKIGGTQVAVWSDGNDDKYLKDALAMLAAPTDNKEETSQNNASESAPSYAAHGAGV